MIFNNSINIMKVYSINIWAFLISLIVMTHLKSFPLLMSSPPSQTNPNCTSTGPNNIHEILLGNCLGNVYMIQMSLGSNEQSFYFQISTGSDLFWVPIMNNSNNKGFNSSASTTYLPSNISETYTYPGGQRVSGFYGSDLIYVPQTKINVTSSDILFVYKKYNLVMTNGVSGLIGMGYSKAPNFLDLAYSAGQISSPVFSLQLNLMNESSYLYYDNGLPSIIADNTIWVRLNSDENWQVQLRGVFFGDKQYTSVAATSAIFDTTSSNFLLNQVLFNAVQPLLLLDGCQNAIGNRIVCPCQIALNNWPTFTFVFPGVKVYINASQYVARQTLNTSQCSYYFGVQNNSQYVVLGDVFFRGYTITFDKPNALIGFYGNTTPVNLFGTGRFLVSQYIIFGLLFLLGIYGVFTLYYLRQQKQKKKEESDSLAYLKL